VEKPASFVSDTAIVGVNLIRKSSLLFTCLDRMMAGGRRTAGEFQLTDALAMMVEEGARLVPFEVDHWFDCGAPESLLETNRHLLGRLPAPAARPGVILVPPVFVAADADLRNSVVGPFVSVGDGVTVVDSVIRDAILADGCTVRGCFLEHSMIGEHAVVEAGARHLNVGDSSEVRMF
jgi:glucose-1-phosphate thymidylyltransferase